MNRTEMVRQALLELGDVPAEEVCSLIEKKYGVKVEPKFLPLFRATIRDLENLTRIRQAARTERPATPA